LSPTPKQPLKTNQQQDSEQKNRKQRKNEERQKIRQDNQRGPDPRSVLDFGTAKSEGNLRQSTSQTKSEGDLRQSTSLKKEQLPDNTNTHDPEKQPQLNQRKRQTKKKNQVIDPAFLGFSVDLKKDYNIVGIDDEE